MHENIIIEHIVPPSGAARLQNLLSDLDRVLIPMLSTRVNIVEYADKLAQKADLFYVKYEGQDIGNCAIYLNDQENGFISSFAIKKEWQKKGIGYCIWKEILPVLKERNIKRVNLKVHDTNKIAIAFYKSIGFKEQMSEDDWIDMKYISDDMQKKSKSEMDIEINRTVLNITTYCNLKCKHCLAFIPYYKERHHMTVEEAENVLKMYFAVVDKVEHFTITGGEPLLNNNLLAILEETAKYADQITGSLDMVTNGTMEMSDEILDWFEKNKNKARVILSNYGENLSKKFDIIEEAFQRRNITYRVSKFYGDNLYYDGWIDFSDQSLKWETEQERDKNASGCLHRIGKYFVINEGELHACSRQFWRIKNGIIPKIKGEYVPLIDESITIEEKKELLKEMYNKKSSTACAYCVGFRNDVPRQYPAQQL